MKGYKLTTAQAKLISGKQYADGLCFNPVKDADGGYFIFADEVTKCTNPEFSWVKQLAVSTFIKPVKGMF